MKQKIILIGGGGHCAACIDVVEQEGRYQVEGILDVAEKVGQSLLGYPIIGTDADIPQLSSNGLLFHITAGQVKSAAVRQQLGRLVEAAGAELVTIVSPHAVISRHARVGKGVTVLHRAVINAGSIIGSCCIVNTGAIVEHDCEVGSFSHISTAACVNGNCRIGDSCFIGSNAVVNQGVQIEDNIVIGSGAVVNKHLSMSGIYVGNPVKLINS